MTSPVLGSYREGRNDRPSQEDIASLRLTPTSNENYRCPVSTPSNYVHRQGRIRRTKPLQGIFSQPTSGGRTHRSHGTDLSRRSRNMTMTTKLAPKVRSGMEYYFVDKDGDRKDAKMTNTYWLKALCAQPVDEILNKYRRKSDVRRTRVIWSKTFTTPGEKSLLNAWENSTINGRSQKTRSAIVGGARSRMGVESVSLTRLTQSEPPLSRAQNYETPENISPGRAANMPWTPGGTLRKAPDVENDLESNNKVSSGILSPKKPTKIKGFLLDENTAGSRVTFYTTQVFVNKDGTEKTVYTKVEEGPEKLPRMSARHKIASMLYNAQYYSRGGARPNSATHSTPLPQSPSPILENDDKEESENQDRVLDGASEGRQDELRLAL